MRADHGSDYVYSRARRKTPRVAIGKEEERDEEVS
jgi:hypothetical protein